MFRKMLEAATAKSITGYRRWPLCGLLVVLFFLIPAAADASRELDKCFQIAFPAPPHVIVEGQNVSGFSIDLLNAALANLEPQNRPCDAMIFPFARGLQELKVRENGVMVNVARTPDREPHYKWVGPVHTVTMSLIGKADRGFDVQSLDDLTTYRVATLIGSAPEKLLLQSGLSKDTLFGVAAPADGIQMLRHGRTDFFAHVYEMLAHEMMERGLDPSDYRPVYGLGTTALYFALNRAVSDRFVHRLQTEIDDHVLGRDPVKRAAYRALLARYGLLEEHPLAVLR